MKTGESFNEYGTPVSKHICDTCGNEFTVCPKIDDSNKNWDNCLGEECDSYDSSRDADKLFGDDGHLYGKVERVPTGRLN